MTDKKKWRVTYTFDKKSFAQTTVEADTFTLALLEFTIRFPNGIATDLVEIGG